MALSNDMKDKEKATKRAFFTCLKIVVLAFIIFLIYPPVFHQIWDAMCFKNKTVKYIEVELEGWPINGSRDPGPFIKPNTKTTLKEPKHICTKNNTDKIYLLIVVCSATSNFKERIVIRDTWGNHERHAKITELFIRIRLKYREYYNLQDINVITKTFPNIYDAVLAETQNNSEGGKATKRTNSKINFQDIGVKRNLKKTEKPIDIKKEFKLIFLLGQPKSVIIQKKIDQEFVKYGDIIQESFIDTYTNLTLKSIFMLKWINSNCGDKVRYILKTDDDSYINLPNLLFNLRKRSYIFDEKNKHRIKTRKEYLMVGSLHTSTQPVRNDEDKKWYCPRYIFAADVYPYYLSGSGYVLSLPTAKALYEAALRTNMIHLEDVYITGYCGPRANPPLACEHDRQFMVPAFVEECDVCCAYPLIVMHYITPKIMWTYNHNLLKWDILDKCEQIRQYRVVHNKAQLYVLCTAIHPGHPSCINDPEYWNI